MAASSTGNPSALPDVRVNRMSSALATASYLAAWPGAYLVGAGACLAQVAGIDRLMSTSAALIAAGFVFCTAAAVYLLDRVKLRDRWLDPADAQAHPRRYSFISAHATSIRILVAGLLLISAVLGSLLFEWAAVVPLLAVTGVLIYAGRPRAARPRPKDILLLKNAYVALGITGFSLLVALAAANPGADLSIIRDFAVTNMTPIALSSVLLCVRVLADAILCDLDDEIADRKFGTETLPNQFGRSRAWNIAFALRLCIAVALVLIPALPLRPRLAWAGATIVSSIVLRVAAPARVRDWVDARLAIEAAAVGAVLAML